MFICTLCLIVLPAVVFSNCIWLIWCEYVHFLCKGCRPNECVCRSFNFWQAGDLRLHCNCLLQIFHRMQLTAPQTGPFLLVAYRHTGFCKAISEMCAGKFSDVQKANMNVTSICPVQQTAGIIC